MAISNLHPWPGTRQEYEAQRLALIKRFEGSSPAPYYDAADTPHPTIGIGFNLDEPDVRTNVYDAMGIPAAKRANLDAILADRSILNAADPDAELRSRLDTELGSPFVMTEPQIAAVFLIEANERETAITASSGVPTNSYEMLALLSAQWAGLYGPGLERALQNDDRAEAWYELRYGWVNTSTASDEAFAKRRFAEAVLFGLRDNDGVSSEDAQKTFRMLQLHRVRIESYEQDYASAIALGNQELAAAGMGGFSAQALEAELSSARSVLVADIRSDYSGLNNSGIDSIAAANIYLDPGRDSSTQSVDENHSSILDSTRRNAQGNEIASNDLLNGEGGSDTLIAGLGDDILIGGAGFMDVLDGGAGYDTYVFSSADGSGINRIVNNDNDGKIVVDGVTLSGHDAQDRGSPALPMWTWNSGGQTFSYMLIGANAITRGNDVIYSDGTLWIQALGGSDVIVVENYSTGDLELDLHGQLDDVKDQAKSDWGDAKRTVSPLVLDLDGDGVETLNVDEGIHFDHDGNGFAEATGWVSSDDGLLVRDLNGNGQIDNGHELFGNNTSLAGGGYAENGFLALADLDSNSDGKLDVNDAAFNQLRVWKDADSDGVADAGELLTLTAAGVQSISTTYTETRLIDLSGNEHLQTGNYITTTGLTRRVDDVWFVSKGIDTFNNNNVVISAEIAALPEVAGFGNVLSLHQAMALDTSGNLRGLVEAFAAQSDPAQRATILRQIVLAWTGADAYAPNSRGPYIADGRIVYAVEAFMGEPFIQGSGTNAGTGSPGPNAAAKLQAIFDNLSDYVNRQLMAQTHLEPLYDSLELVPAPGGGGVVWDISGTLALLQAAYGADPQAGLAMLVDFADSLKSDGARGDVIRAQLRAAGDLNSPGLLRDLAMMGTDVHIAGTNGPDSLNGTTGNDLITSSGGNDTISGGQGDDVLDGGTGDDVLTGGDGSDTYVFNLGEGRDTINNYDFSGHDALEFGPGITESSLVLSRAGDNLVIGISGTSDQVTVTNYFVYDTTSPNALDSIRFRNGVFWSRSDINSNYLAGLATSGNDSISTFSSGSSLHGLAGDDTLNGGAGADFLYGDDGNDLVKGAAGNDSLSGGAGNDTLNGDSGDDVLDGGEGADLLTGGVGSDVYLFGRGSGQDTVQNSDSGASKVDAILIAADVAPADVLVGRNANADLILSIAGTADTMTVLGYFNNDGANTSKVEEIRFADGTVWNLDTVKARALIGTEGSQTLYGYATADVVHAGGGADTIFGYAGGDTLHGDAGNDLLYGGADNDVLRG